MKITVISIALLLLVTAGCGQQNTSDGRMNITTLLTADQAIAYVQTYALPRLTVIDGYGRVSKPLSYTPIGYWSAVNESKGVWRVSGTVQIVTGASKVENYSTTWRFDSLKGQISLELSTGPQKLGLN